MLWHAFTQSCTGKKYYGLSEIMSSIVTIMSRIRNLPINMIVDTTILAQAEAEAVLHIILKCLRDNAEERPIMLDVAKQLTRIRKYLSSLNSFLYVKLVSIEKNTFLYVVLPSFNIIFLIFLFMSFFFNIIFVFQFF